MPKTKQPEEIVEEQTTGNNEVEENQVNDEGEKNDTNKDKFYRCHFRLTPEESQQLDKFILVRETHHVAARRLLLTYMQELESESRNPAPLRTKHD